MAYGLRMRMTMRSRFRRSSSGFSLIELLTVVAIIGVLSLISVPAFMNFRRSADFKSGMRNFTTDLRNARAAAISNSFDVRCEIDLGSISLKSYRFFSSRDNMTTWTPLQLRGTHGATPQTSGNMKQFAFSTWAQSEVGLPDVDGNGLYDIVYHPNGAMTFATGATTASLVLATDWKKIAFDRYTIQFSPSGQFRVVGSHS